MMVEIGFLKECITMEILDRFRLDGKRVFISGGSRGLGREMALALASAGADIVLAARDQSNLEQTAEEIRRYGREVVPLQADMGEMSDCERVCQMALQQGPIDILVNNVGGRRVNIPTVELPLETWRQLVDLNLTSTFLCTKLIGGAMVHRGEGGRVINIASIAGMIANREIGGRCYEAAKAAVIQFTRATAVDWAPARVTVNAICPGFFMTEPNRHWKAEYPELIKTAESQIPMSEFGQPEDLGPLAVYLASDAARYVTGATMVIDGGYTLW